MQRALGFAPHSGARSQRRDAWTIEDEEMLKAMAENGCYIQEVAKALGRTQQAVSHRANRLGVSLRSAPSKGRANGN